MMTKDDLENVNDKRQVNKYMYEDTSNEIKRGSVKKEKLTKYNFVATSEYGASAEGYWTYGRMILQLEDSIDCLKVMYPQYDFLINRQWCYKY